MEARLEHKAPVDTSDPLVHLVGGGHARQREIQAVRQTVLHEALTEDQCSLGLSRARHVFQQEQLRPAF